MTGGGGLDARASGVGLAKTAGAGAGAGGGRSTTGAGACFHPDGGVTAAAVCEAVPEAAAATLEAVRRQLDGRRRVLVILDSNHTHDHVLAELELYAPLVTAGSYLIVFDTLIENMPEDFYPDRPWGKGDNAMTAVHAFLGTTDRFEIDKEIQNKLLITAAPDGYLRCLRD